MQIVRKNDKKDKVATRIDIERESNNRVRDYGVVK